MRIVKAFSRTFSFSQKASVAGEAPSIIAPAETLDRTSSSDVSSSSDCDSSSTASPCRLNHVQQSTTIQEEDDGAVDLIFDHAPTPKKRVKKREGRTRRGRSRHRRNSHEIPTNADPAADVEREDEHPTLVTRKGRGKLRRALTSSLRSVKGELRRMKDARGQEMVVIEPVDTFEMHQEIRRKVSSAGSFGL
jgi:hypothetical protein